MRRPAVFWLAPAARIDWILMSILALGLFLRLNAALRLNSFLPDSAAPLRGDEPLYANIARSLVHGVNFDWPGRAPLYPAFLAVLFWGTRESYHAVRILQSIFGMSTILLTYYLGGRLFGRPTARLAALFAAASQPLYWQGLRIMSEALFTPLLLMVVICSVKAFEKPGWREWAVLGFSIGVSDLTRPTLLLYPIFLILVFLVMPPWRKLLRHGIVCLFSAVLTVLPWVVHTYLKYHALIPLTTSNAFLWQGSPEYYHLIHDQGYTYMRIWTEVLYGPNWREHDPMGIEGDKYWTRRAIDSIRAEPLVYIRFALEKVITYWTGDSSADWGGRSLFSYRGLMSMGYYSRKAAIEAIVGRAVPIFAVIAVFVLRNERRRLAPVYIILIFTTLFHATTHAEARLSEPFQPLLLSVLAASLQRFRGYWFGTPRPQRQPEP